jgi:hypothetical protein
MSKELAIFCLVKNLKLQNWNLKDSVENVLPRKLKS